MQRLLQSSVAYQFKMSNQFTSSALTFEVVAKCSVRTFSVANVVMSVNLDMLDYQSSCFDLNLTSWTRITAYIPARRYPSISEGIDTEPTLPAGLQFMPE